MTTNNRFDIESDIIYSSHKFRGFYIHMKLQICLSEYMFDLATGDDERNLLVLAKRAKDDRMTVGGY